MEILCRECMEPIKITTKVKDLRVFHPECYAKFLKQYKEYGIRIGARIHGKKKKK